MSRSRVLLLATQLLLLASAAPSTAAAQPDEYRIAIQSAVQEFEAEHWEEAQLLFEHAHGIYPSARALWGAGLAAFEQRNYATALRYFRAATDTLERPLLPDQRANAEDMTRRCMVFTARYTLEVTPANATVTVDGLPATIIDGELVMNPGRHEIVIAAEGYEPITRTVNALPSLSNALVIALAPLPEPDVRPDLSRAAWAALGSGAGLGITAFVTGGVARRTHSELRATCGGPCPEDRQQDVDRGRRLARTSAALTVMGAAALGTGIVLLVTEVVRDGSGEAPPQAGLRFTPHVGRHEVGGDLRVAF